MSRIPSTPKKVRNLDAAPEPGNRYKGERTLMNGSEPRPQDPPKPLNKRVRYKPTNI